MVVRYLTVKDLEIAQSIDPNFVVERVLPPAPLVYTYCCKDYEEVGLVPSRYVVRVNVDTPRKVLEGIRGVIRVRCKLLERYRTVIYSRQC